jgi:hypothetical protein
MMFTVLKEAPETFDLIVTNGTSAVREVHRRRRQLKEQPRTYFVASTRRHGKYSAQRGHATVRHVRAISAELHCDLFGE